MLILLLAPVILYLVFAFMAGLHNQGGGDQ